MLIVCFFLLGSMTGALTLLCFWNHGPPVMNSGRWNRMSHSQHACMLCLMYPALRDHLLRETYLICATAWSPNPSRSDGLCNVFFLFFFFPLLFWTGPNWASLNRGVLICDDCACIHAKLGRHVSHIRSVPHGYWPDTLLEVRFATGRRITWTSFFTLCTISGIYWATAFVCGVTCAYAFVSMYDSIRRSVPMRIQFEFAHSTHREYGDAQNVGERLLFFAYVAVWISFTLIINLGRLT